MKLAWLVWRYEEDKDNFPEIRFAEPEEGWYYKVIPIVYAEIVK